MAVDRYQLVWEDDIDRQSHGTVISIEEGEDPYERARSYLEGTAGPGKGNYLIDFVRKLKDDESGREF